IAGYVSGGGLPGTIASLSGSNSYSGPITVDSLAGTINTAAGSTLTLTGTLTLAGAPNCTVTAQGAGSTVFNGTLVSPQFDAGLVEGLLTDGGFDTTSPNPGTVPNGAVALPGYGGPQLSPQLGETNSVND